MRKRKQKKRKGFLRTLLCGVMVFMAFACSETAVHAYSNRDLPGVQSAPDGDGWTVVDPLPVDTDPSLDSASYWIDAHTTINTGISRNLQQPGVGQHFYTYNREGVIPVYKWEVVQKEGHCIHQETGRAVDQYGVDGYHGIVRTDNICYGEYWSGWNPWCADCGSMFWIAHYMSPETVAQIQYIDLDPAMNSTAGPPIRTVRETDTRTRKRYITLLMNIMIETLPNLPARVS